MLLSLFG